MIEEEEEEEELQNTGSYLTYLTALRVIHEVQSNTAQFEYSAGANQG